MLILGLLYDAVKRVRRDVKVVMNDVLSVDSWL